jgi:hypothetical protein
MGRPRSAWREYAVGSEVAHFAKFCEQHLVQSEDRWEGHPLRLEAWQRRMMGEALAYDSSGWPMWRSVVIVAPRKNGKTALLAAVALYRLLTAEGRPEILLAASSDKQADRLFSAAARFVRRSPELSRLCRVRDHVGEIVREDGMGVIYRLSSDAKRLHGYNPTDVICDELAQWITKTLRDAFAALTSGGGARSAPQVFTITTAGEASTRHDSILGRILDAMTPEETEHASAALQIGRLAEAQTLVWKYEAPTTDARDIKALKMANPASWITKEYLRRQTANPELSDAEVLQLHGCVWAGRGVAGAAPRGARGRRARLRDLRRAGARSRPAGLVRRDRPVDRPVRGGARGRVRYETGEAVRAGVRALPDGRPGAARQPQRSPDPGPARR